MVYLQVAGNALRRGIWVKGPVIYRQEGVKFYSYEKQGGGGAENVLDMMKGWAGGGGAQHVLGWFYQGSLNS